MLRGLIRVGILVDGSQAGWELPVQLRERVAEAAFRPHPHTLRPHTPSHPPQVKTAYHLLDSFHHGGVDGQPSVTALMEEAEALRKQQDLFELYVSEYVFLQRCMVRWLGRAGCRGLLVGGCLLETLSTKWPPRCSAMTRPSLPHPLTHPPPTHPSAHPPTHAHTSSPSRRSWATSRRCGTL